MLNNNDKGSKKETDIFQERKELIQDVIDRELRYGDRYKQALKDLNKKFPINYTTIDYARVSSKFKETT